MSLRSSAQEQWWTPEGTDHQPWSPAELFSLQPIGQPLSPGIQNLEVAPNSKSSHLSAGPQTMSLWTEKWWNRDILKQEAVGVRVRLPLMKSVDMKTQQRVVVRIKWVYISKGLERYLTHNLYNSHTHTHTHTHSSFLETHTCTHTHYSLLKAEVVSSSESARN